MASRLRLLANANPNHHVLRHSAARSLKTPSTRPAITANAPRLPSSSAYTHVPRRHLSLRSWFNAKKATAAANAAFGNDRFNSQFEPALEQKTLFYPLSKSPLAPVRQKAEWIRQHGTCPVCKEQHPTEKSQPPVYECPDCGYPTHCSEDHYHQGKHEHQHVCSTLRQVNEDEHDLRSGRRLKEFEFPGAQHRDEAVNLSNWDTFLYTRGFLSMNSERSMRHVSHVLTYPMTIASVLHQSSPYQLGKDLTIEGLKSLAALRHTLHPTRLAGSASGGELKTTATNTVRVFCLGARAESQLPAHVWSQLAYLFPSTAFQIHFVGPDAIPPGKAAKGDHQNTHFENMTFVYDKSRYEAYHAEAGPFNPYFDVFFLFSPGLAHPATKGMWKPTIPLLLDTKCAIFGTGFNQTDVENDVHELESCGLEMDWLMKPRDNVFKSLKHEVNVTDLQQTAQCNWGVWGIRGRRYDVRPSDQE
ncbi:translational activator for mitochondrial COX1 [Actinomortierella ambigua]|nr:translational activator for mitochondrial COX1 [Actinomortierella ambigua]